MYMRECVWREQVSEQSSDQERKERERASGREGGREGYTENKEERKREFNGCGLGMMREGERTEKELGG